MNFSSKMIQSKNVYVYSLYKAKLFWYVHCIFLATDICSNVLNLRLQKYLLTDSRFRLGSFYFYQARSITFLIQNDRRLFIKDQSIEQKIISIFHFSGIVITTHFQKKTRYICKFNQIEYLTSVIVQYLVEINL